MPKGQLYRYGSLIICFQNRCEIFFRHLNMTLEITQEGFQKYIENRSCHVGSTHGLIYSRWPILSKDKNTLELIRMVYFCSVFKERSGKLPKDTIYQNTNIRTQPTINRCTQLITLETLTRHFF